MTLSPDAQAVIDAFRRSPAHDRIAIAGALRAAVEQSAYPIFPGLSVINADDILAIAAELENAS